MVRSRRFRTYRFSSRSQASDDSSRRALAGAWSSAERETRVEHRVEGVYGEVADDDDELITKTIAMITAGRGGRPRHREDGARCESVQAEGGLDVDADADRGSDLHPDHRQHPQARIREDVPASRGAACAFGARVRTKSCGSVSATLTRIMRAYSARKSSAKVNHGRARCAAQSVGPLHRAVRAEDRAVAAGWWPVEASVEEAADEDAEHHRV